MNRSSVIALCFSVLSAYSTLNDRMNEAAAAEASSGSALQLEEIIVTAQKRSERINDVPLSITAATGDELLKAGVKGPDDLQKVVPGFTYEASEYGMPIFTIRGIGYLDNSLAIPPAVSVYVDQVPYSYLAMTPGTSLDVERVEVLKGPQGTLFGQNSTGGAINFIANKPTPDLHYGGDLSYGRFNDLDVQGFVSGPLSKDVTARLALRTEQRFDGWQQSVSRDATLGQKNFFTGRSLLDWQASDALRFELNINGWQDKSDTQASQYIEYSPRSTNYTDLRAAILADTPAPKNDRAADWDPGTSFANDNNFYQVSLHGVLDIADNISLTSISAYSKLSMLSPIDPDGVQQSNFRITTHGSIETVSQEVRLAGQAVHDRLNWMVGANYGLDATKDDQHGHSMASNTGIGPFRFVDFVNSNHQNIENKAGFASLDYEIVDKLTVQTSVRYNTEDRKFKGCLLDAGDGASSAAFSFLSNLLTGGNIVIPPGACVTLSDGSQGTPPGVPLPVVVKRLNEDNTSWRSGLSWKATPDTMLYANVTKGFKAGSFPTIPALTPAQFAPATQESVLAYEAGFKASILNRTVQVNGAAFYYKYNEKQIAGYIPTLFGPLPALINVPHSSVRGGELSVTAHPITGLFLNVGATYVGSRVDGDFLANGAVANVFDIKGEAFPDTPKWQVISSADYEFPVSERFNAFLGAGVQYRSSSFSAFGATAMPEFRLPGFASLDLSAGVASPDDKWRLQFWGRNVTNTFSIMHVGQLSDTVARTTGMPVTYGMTIGYRY